MKEIKPVNEAEFDAIVTHERVGRRLAEEMILERGYDQVGGYVVKASAAAEVRTPGALRAAYGIADVGMRQLTWCAR